MIIQRKQRSLIRVMVFLALYYSLVINLPFLRDVFITVSPSMTWFFSLGMVMLAGCFLFCVAISLLSLICIRGLTKPISIICILLSSLLSYAALYYGVQFDDYSPIIGIIEQFPMKEIKPFISYSLGLWFLATGLVPALFIMQTRILYPRWKQEIVLKMIGVSIYPLFYLLLILPHWSHVQPVLRLSGLAAKVPFQLIPTNFMESAWNHYLTKLTLHQPYQTLGLDAERSMNMIPEQPYKILVLVIGETARLGNFQWNGYSRATNRYTFEQNNMVSFRQVSACATATRISVPCLFSAFTRKQFHAVLADRQDNLLDILKRVGLNVLWFDNNGPGDCQGVCKHVKSTVIDGFDEQFIKVLKKQLREARGQDTVLVFHLQGSHGSDYYARYPARFAVFKPECKSNEIRFCDRTSLQNAYDNSIIYTDYVLHKLIHELTRDQAHWQSALIYTSDHGESIGEHGVYGHCAPYLIAPKEQTSVPFLVWLSPSWAKDQAMSMPCLDRVSKQQAISHDYFFHSVLGLLDVKTSIYRPDLDVFHACRDRETHS